MAGKAWGGAASWSGGASWSAAPAWGKASKAPAKAAYGKGMVGKGPYGGKDKGKGALPKDDKYWTDKLGEENRIESDGLAFTGTIAAWNAKFGWGFIAPDDPETLPEDVQAQLKEKAAEQTAKGKTVENEFWLYFRKPDTVDDFEP